MNTVISKKSLELIFPNTVIWDNGGVLGEVTKFINDKGSYEVRDTTNTVWYHCINAEINIHELSDLCKKYLVKLGYIVCTQYEEDSYIASLYLNGDLVNFRGVNSDYYEPLAVFKLIDSVVAGTNKNLILF